jgi:hypothetical protein
MEHLLKSDTKKWSTYKIYRVSGEIPCIDARMGLWAQSAYLAKDWARRDILSVKMKNKIHY